MKIWQKDDLTLPYRLCFYKNISKTILVFSILSYPSWYIEGIICIPNGEMVLLCERIGFRNRLASALHLQDILLSNASSFVSYCRSKKTCPFPKATHCENEQAFLGIHYSMLTNRKKRCIFILGKFSWEKIPSVYIHLFEYIFPCFITSIKEMWKHHIMYAMKIVRKISYSHFVS